MELSPENIEDLAIAMSGNANPTGMLDAGHSSSDPQTCLLNTSIEAMRACSASCSFNDILDDICEMNKTSELDQSSANTSNLQLPFPALPDLTMGSPAFYHMPDIGMQQGDYSPDCNFSNQTDFLQPFGQWPEYLSSLPSALDGLQEVPHLLTRAPTPPPPPPPPQQPQSPPPQDTLSDAAAVNVNVNLDELQLVSSAPVPLQFFNNFHFNFSPPIVPQSEPPNSNPQFVPAMNKNINFLMMKDQSTVLPKKRPRIQKQMPCLGWARVVPRKAFVQPTEVMILRPLRTRKAASSRPSFDLSSYFDTSAISIPMIGERPRCKNANRRKQKLRTIPGAENMIFEVQLQPTNNEGKNDHIAGNGKNVDANNNADQLYPETETPELDEIFKRKRRGFSTRRNPQLQNQAKTPLSSHTGEEEKSVTPTLLKEDRVEIVESNSDVDSDDAPLTAVKSMKCQHCRKLFKTCRSLTIHSKRCDAMHHIPQKDKPPDYDEIRSVAQTSSSKENIDIKNEGDMLKQTLTLRPLTRSQTNAAKRKAAGSRSDVAAKRKC